MKNPIIAAILNIIPELGYLYIGRRKFFGVSVLFACLSFFAAQVAYEVHLLNNPVLEAPISIVSTTGFIYSLALIALLVLVVAFMYDAYQDAQHWNNLQAR